MPKRGSKSNSQSKKIEDKLIENMVELQKLNVKMIEKFEALTSQVSALLNLFEVAAKSFAGAPSTQIAVKDKEFLEKIDRLLDQNKTLAKGLTLMEEKLRERVYGTDLSQPNNQNKRTYPSQIDF